MVNLAVEWAGPNFSLSTLAKELNAKFGAPKRAYEYVTGYKSAANVSGHNADNNGRGHSMDIFVGVGQNISVEQGIDLAERLRLEGKKGDIPGHPDRLAYIIHRGRIAGDHTNWEWVAYNGIADHYDHIHVSSVFDYYWGDPVAGNPADYNSTQAWNLWGATSGQGSDITPIPEKKDWFDMATPSELRTIVREEVALLFDQGKHLTYKNPKNGPDVWGIITGTHRDAVKLVAEQAAQRSIIDQLAKGQGVAIDYAKLDEAIAGAVDKSVKDAIAGSISIEGTVVVGGAK